jgi:dTMP kinase
MLINFEGIDGCGKSTQIHLLKQYLEERGKKVQVYREPGGTSIAEEIRSILLDSKYEISAVSELLLFSAARAQLVQDKIIPALERGITVILDRFYDSTTAYQGYGRSVLPIDEIILLNKMASHGLVPEITFYLRISQELALQRRKERAQDRMEMAGYDFYSRVLKGYEMMAKKHPRFIVLDGAQPIESIAKQILSHI